MYKREDLIFGITFIGVGIVIFLFTVWSEPLLVDVDFNEWFILGIRIVGVICILAGIIGIIAGLIPRKEQEVFSNRNCPKCGREIPFDSVVCPYCQHDFK